MASTVFSVVAEFETVRSLAFGSVSGTYMGIGTAFPNTTRILFIQNLTDGTLMFSNDGINDKFPLPPQSFLLLDITSNKSQDSGLYFPENMRIYVKEVTAPTVGSVYVSSIYGTTR